MPETEIDWQAARLFLRRVLSRRLVGTASADLEDLVQESLIKLLRAIRKEPARNLEALMTRIAEWTRIDFVRKRRTWAPLLQSTDDPDSVDAHSAPDSLDGVGDPAARLAFTVLEFFGPRSSRCHELARRYFDEQDWNEVAQELGQSPEAVRQQWSRCLRQLRRAASEHPELLWAWAHPADTERT